ncbi:MAG: hypothetical protein HY332_14585, partial [Chloroflexi bacterium]|nr:hypothetical protein [Chloroflexota bacterium]
DPGRQRAQARDLARLCALPAWIIEGCYPGWIDELARASDLIVWLDVPFWRAAWRIVKRHVLADLRGNNRHPGYRRLWRFLRGQHGYYTRPDAEYRRRLAREGHDRWSGALHCREHAAAEFERHRAKMLRVTGGSPERIAREVEAAIVRLTYHLSPPTRTEEHCMR